MKRLHTLLSVSLMASLFFITPLALAAPQQTGAVVGKVLDELTGSPLPGAVVAVEGLARSEESNRAGSFQLLRIPTGKHTITVTYLGYETATFEVEIQPGRTSEIEAKIKPLPEVRESVTVQAEPSFIDGQAKALNQQKSALNIINVVSADQIGRFPDPNAAEAAQRVPGITIQRDQGEGRYVVVRGTEPRLNSMMINGERVPSPEGDIRNVALDVIPADLLEAIEVSKALTPDMDADSIGGSVNLVTKQAPEKQRIAFTLGLGYNEIVRDGIQQLNGTYGRRFFNDKLGMVVSGSFFNTDRGSQNFEAEYDDGFLDTLDLRDYHLNRTRWGLNTDLDYRLSKDSHLFLRGIFNKFDDDEYRRRLVSAVGDDALERHLRDRYESQTIYSIAAGGRHLFNSLWQLDYKLAFSYAQEDEPRNLQTIFIQEDVVFQPNVSPDRISPDNIQSNPLNEDINEYVLDEMVLGKNITNERDWVGSFNLATPFTLSGRQGGLFKFGGKYRYKKKARNNEEIEFSPEEDILLTDFLDRSYEPRQFLDGRYRPGNQFVNPDAARQFTSNFDFESEKNFEEDTADFVVKEKVAAAYAMTELYLGEKLSLLPGLRFEHTKVDSTGFEALFNTDGDFESLRALTGSNSYYQFLPGIHMRYRITPNANIRAAFTRTLARPNYVDLTPFQIINEEDEEITRGNPSLDPTTSWNFDLLGERYFSTIGVLSAGLFYKRLKNNIFLFTSEETRNGTEFDVTEPLNGESGRMFGVEVAFQNQLRFLPKPFDGFGIYANYTYVDSGADLLSRKIRLPGQAEHSGNFAVFYEKFGFMGRLSLNYHGQYIEEVAEESARDIFFDSHAQWDFSASQRVTRKLRVFIDVINLTNEPLRRFEGFSNRPLQEEYYKWWATAGIKIDF